MIEKCWVEHLHVHSSNGKMVIVNIFVQQSIVQQLLADGQ